MSNVEKYDDLIIGSGIAGKFTAWTRDSRRMVVMQTAMLGHLPYTVLRDAILTHPTMSEGLGQLLANVPTR